MADTYTPDSSYNPTSDPNVRKNFVNLLSTVMYSILKGQDEEEIMGRYGRLIRNLPEQNGQPVIPEAFHELAARGIREAAELGVTQEMLLEDTSEVAKTAADIFDRFWEDVYVENQSGIEVVANDIADTIENSLDADDITGELFTDADIVAFAKGREVTTANFFLPDGSPDPEGAFSEKIFGPIHGVSCECGKTRSGTEQGSVVVGEICPDCGTEARSCSDRKTTWAYVQSPIPLLFGREELVGAMLLGVMDDYIYQEIHNPTDSNRPMSPAGIVSSMANGESLYVWTYNTETKEGKIVDGGTAIRLMEMRNKNGQRIYSIQGGIRGVEAALEYMDAHRQGQFRSEDRNSALFNAYEYYRLRVHQNDDAIRSGDRDLIKNAAQAMSDAEASYNALYSFIEERKLPPSAMLLHSFPVPPPAMRPVNDRNGKTDLGDINESLQKLIHRLISFSRMSSQMGFGWIGSNAWKENSGNIKSAQDEYLDVIRSKLVGKTGLVRGRQKSEKTDTMTMAVCVPDDQEEKVAELRGYGLRDIIPPMITGVPAASLRKMYEKEVCKIMKEGGMSPKEIRAALREPAGTMVNDETFGKVRCVADQALIAAMAGYGQRKTKNREVEYGKMFVPEGNRFGMSRSQARIKYEDKIREALRGRGLYDEEIEEEMGKAAGTLEDGKPCLADRILENLCGTRNGGIITALSRDPIINATGVQMSYVYPVFGSTIHVHPLLMKGFAGDFDGDRLAAIRLIQHSAHREMKRLVARAFREDGTGAINQGPTLESLIGLHRMTKTYGDRPEFSLKYDAIVTGVTQLENAGDIKNGTATRASDIIVHRIEDTLEGKEIVAEKDKTIPPGHPYAKDADGKLLYTDKYSIIMEKGGKSYLVDAYPDSVRVPLGAKLTIDPSVPVKAGTPLAEARMFIGTVQALKAEMDGGRVTPMSKIILEEPDGTERITTAGRALVEQHLPSGVRIEGDEGITAKWIAKTLDNYLKEREEALVPVHGKEEARTQATLEAMEVASDLTLYGFDYCSQVFGTGASFQDFFGYAPIDPTTITKDDTIPTDDRGQAEYKKLSKEAVSKYYEYAKDYNTSYVMDVIGSGEKGRGLLEAIVNRNVTNTYSGASMPVTGMNVVLGIYGFANTIAVAESIVTNNKTHNVDKAGAARNKADAIVDGMEVESGDCETSLFLEGPLESEKSFGDYEGRYLGKDVVIPAKGSAKEAVVQKDTLITKDLMKEMYARGVRAIPYRSAITCRCEGVCEKCAGTNRNIQTGPGDEIGHAAVSAFFQPITQGIMDVAKKAMASGAKRETGLDGVRDLYDGILLYERLNGIFNDEMELDEKEVNQEELLAIKDELGDFIKAKFGSKGEVDAITTAQVLADEIMELAERKIPVLYAEILAKRLILARPEKLLDARNDNLSDHAPKRPLLTVTELVNYNLKGRGAIQTRNPGIGLAKGGKDAAMDAVSKSRTTGQAGVGISSAIVNVTKGTEAQPATEDYLKEIKATKEKSRSIANKTPRPFGHKI